MKPFTPFKAICLGTLLGISAIALIAAAKLTTYVGKFYGDGAGLTNVLGSANSTAITNAAGYLGQDGTLAFTNSNGYVQVAPGGLFAAYEIRAGELGSDTAPGAGIIRGLFFGDGSHITNLNKFGTVIVTNNVLFSTNAFPLAAGTTWDWSRYYQRIITNADFNITAIGGLSNNFFNQAILQVSNSSGSQIICHLQFSMTKYGPLTTNDLYIPGSGQVEVDGNAPGIGVSTNIATIASQ